MIDTAASIEATFTQLDNEARELQDLVCNAYETGAIEWHDVAKRTCATEDEQSLDYMYSALASVGRADLFTEVRK